MIDRQVRFAGRFLLPLTAGLVALLVCPQRAQADAPEKNAEGANASQDGEAIQPPPPPFKPGIGLGIDLIGYAFPLGAATGAPGDSLSDAVGGQASSGFDAGARFTPSMFAAIFAGAGVGLEKRGQSQRLGILFQYTFLPREKWRPWAGVGIGREWVTRTTTDPAGAESSVDFGGMFGLLQGGILRALGETSGFGPSANLGVGAFTSRGTSGAAAPQPPGTADATVHAWMTLGLRVVVR